jgi:hypothetical protein
MVHEASPAERLDFRYRRGRLEEEVLSTCNKIEAFIKAAPANQPDAPEACPHTSL